MASKTYKLILYFDKSQLKKSELSSKVKKAIRKHLKNVQFFIDGSRKDYLVLQIKGSLAAVDSCHACINKKLLPNFSSIRVLDQAGDMIRRKSFTVLSRIEQSLRAFINRAMTEVKGWDWWNDWSPPNIQQKVSKRKKSSEYHSIELTDFEDIIIIMTGSFQDWSDNKMLSATDLKSLLDKCCTLEELKECLNKKVQKKSTWDEVFAYYFPDANAWHELSEELRESTLIIRNKVMHHRPIHLFDLERLRSVDKKIKKLLSSAKKQLPKAEREKVKINLQGITASWQKQMQAISAATRPAFERLNKLSFPVPDIISSYMGYQGLARETLIAKKMIETQISPLLAMQKAALKHLQEKKSGSQPK